MEKQQQRFLPNSSKLDRVRVKSVQSKISNANRKTVWSTFTSPPEEHAKNCVHVSTFAQLFTL